MKQDIYKGYEITKNKWGYYEAVNLTDCDAYIIFAITREGLIIKIDKLKIEK